MKDFRHSQPFCVFLTLIQSFALLWNCFPSSELSMYQHANEHSSPPPGLPAQPQTSRSRPSLYSMLVALAQMPFQTNLDSTHGLGLLIQMINTFAQQHEVRRWNSVTGGTKIHNSARFTKGLDIYMGNMNIQSC